MGPFNTFYAPSRASENEPYIQKKIKIWRSVLTSNMSAEDNIGTKQLLYEKLSKLREKTEGEKNSP